MRPGYSAPRAVGVLGGLRIAFTLKGVYIAQTLLALPYTVALTAAAVNGLPPGLLAQARALGVPVGLVIGLGRFRGREALRILANASMGLPPVVVGLVLFLVFVPAGPLGSLHLNATRTG
jgi:tungstate transport system permease protein